MITANVPRTIDAAPPVWVLLGHKAGDNNQVLALAESLRLPFTERHLRYRPTELLSNLMCGPTLLGIDSASRSALAPPWPRLVISAGRRNEPVARWIRRRAGHDVRLVHVGRPWANPDRFDLIVTTPQYELPDRPNVLRVDLPLHRITRARLEEHASRWLPQLGHLPPPRIALLAGGESGRFHLDATKARRLGRMASELAAQMDGSLLITTSARTPRGAADALADAVTVPHYFFRWRPAAQDNPYLAFLALADQFIVTGESMSMLTEASCMRRPLHIFDMHDTAEDRRRATGRDRLTIGLRHLANMLRYRSLTHRLAQRLGPPRMRRDVGRLQAALIRSGRAVYLGQVFPDRPPPPLPDTREVTARVLALLAGAPDESGAAPDGP
jgi:mitochondrial fission protein ELM1